MIQMPNKKMIRAWGECDKDRGGYSLGHLHGPQLYFPVDTPHDEMVTAVTARRDEIRRRAEEAVRA